MTKAIKENINKAKQGNQLAFGFLFSHYWDTVYFYIYNKTKDEDEAEDITVKAFAKAFDKNYGDKGIKPEVVKECPGK